MYCLPNRSWRGGESPRLRSHCGLERQFQAELYEPWVVHRGANRAEAGAAREIGGLQAGRAIWRRELRMIEQVENLCPEIQTHSLTWQGELFDDGKVGIDEIRSGQRGARCVAQFPWRRLRKRARIEPVGDCMHLRGAACAASGFIRIANQIRTDQAVRVTVQQVGAAGVCAV